MEKKINVIENQQVEIVITCSGEEWKKAQKKEVAKREANLTVKGFRKGHVPSNIAQKYINMAEVINDVLLELVNKGYAEAVNEGKYQVFSEPKLGVNKVNADEFEATVTFALPPHVELGAYKGLKAAKQNVTVTEDDVNNHIEELRSQNATMNVKDGEAKLGDTVIIDFKGFINDSPFDGGEAKGHELKLGSNSFVPGFEDQLVGIKADESRSINITFPENYVEELKGKEDRFDVVCHDVKETVLPEINEEFFEELNIADVKDLEALKAHSRKVIEERKIRENDNAYLNELYNTIIANSNVVIADQLVEAEANAQIEDMKKQVESKGLTFKDYLSINGITEEKLLEDKKVEARVNLKGMLVIEEIARVENIVVTKEILDAKFEELANQYGMKKEDVENALANNVQAFARNLRNSMINEFILKNNSADAE